jgi:hypothetical protein
MSEGEDRPGVIRFANSFQKKIATAPRKGGRPRAAACNQFMRFAAKMN